MQNSHFFFKIKLNHFLKMSNLEETALDCTKYVGGSLFSLLWLKENSKKAALVLKMSGCYRIRGVGGSPGRWGVSLAEISERMRRKSLTVLRSLPTICPEHTSLALDLSRWHLVPCDISCFFPIFVVPSLLPMPAKDGDSEFYVPV